MPSEPDISIHEFSAQLQRPIESRGNAVSGAIRLAETPMPINSTSEHQMVEAARQREPHAANYRHHEQRQQHAACAVTVEQPSHRQLHAGKAEEVHAGQQAQVAGTQLQLARELRRQGGDHRSQQRREKVVEGKRREDQAHAPWPERIAPHHGATLMPLKNVDTTASSGAPPTTVAW